MNILPQKSWHVRRKENVEKVRRDEAEAEEKRLELERRHARAEAEALRARLGGGPQRDEISAKGGGHLNLFWDHDFDNNEKNKATHREQEQKDETEKWARKVGISVGLNDKSEEAANHWLFGSSQASKSGSKLKMVEDLAAQKKQQKDLKRKNIEDPMNAFAMKVKRDDHGTKSDYAKSDKYSAELAYEALNKSKEKSSSRFKSEKKKKKDKKKKRHKSRSNSSDSDSSLDSNEKSRKKSNLEQLRKERLAREEKERKRAEDLLKSKNLVS